HCVSLLYQLGLLTRQIAQLTLLAIGDKTRPQQPTLQELRDPLRIFHVGLSPRHFLDVLGINDPNLQMPFKHVEHRLPVHSGRFHRRVRYLFVCQPLAQLHKIGGHGPKAPQRALHCAILRIEDAHARHHNVLVHIHTAHTTVQRCQPRTTSLLLTHRRSPFLSVDPGNFRLVRFSFACSRRQTTRRQSEVPMEVPDHTPSSGSYAPLTGRSSLWATTPSYRASPPFSSSRGVREYMKRSFVDRCLEGTIFIETSSLETYSSWSQSCRNFKIGKESWTKM